MVEGRGSRVEGGMRSTVSTAKTMRTALAVGEPPTQP